ncbi:MAG: 5-histidylcysteine sulfoxide synthase [Paludibacteraceae bacterium]|nr:5-histidylcysteine sulfoxide synthase [Paludibacteraceae bacterium]
MQQLITQTIDLKNGKADDKRREIREYFEKTWAVDELLYTQLKSDEVFYHRGDPLRHVLLFYLGHTAVFFINKFFLAKMIDTRINPDFESIFAIGVDEMSWDDLDERHYNWPKVSEVREYRGKAKAVILNIIDNAPLKLPITWDDPFWIVLMGIEHERIHLETSSVLIRQLPLNEVLSGRFGSPCTEYGEAPSNKMLPVPGGEIKLGKPANHHFYGWDNEYGNHTEMVADFKTSKFLCSNAEFLEFILDNGYVNKSNWTEEGWHWRNFKQANMPLFWRKNADEYRLRLVAEEIPMPWNWPVEVNYLEAKAYCNWRSAREGITYRLPTEAEWYRLAEHCKIADVGERQRAQGNLNLEKYSSACPVNMFAQGDFYDVAGNVWQWTETPISGFAGFKVHPMYDDFSTPTFDGKHNIIKGGSWISTGNEATLHARYAFRRHFYQHAGFRIVASEQALVIHNNEYETDAEVTLACEAEWTTPDPQTQNFSQQLATHILKITNQKPGKVLDLNADTGRLAFELAPFSESITAIDFSARFIRMPVQMRDQEFMRYIVTDECELLHYREIVLSEIANSTGSKKIQFLQDNANNLKTLYTDYNLIILAQLLEELTLPVSFLQKIHKRLLPGGLLVIASTYNWDRNNIERSQRPGGFKRDGEPVNSYEGIKDILSPHFSEFTQAINLTQIRPLSSRTSEYRNCEVSVWKKRN